METETPNIRVHLANGGGTVIVEDVLGEVNGNGFLQLRRENRIVRASFAPGVWAWYEVVSDEEVLNG